MKTLQNTRSAGNSNRTKTQAGGSATMEKNIKSFYEPTESVINVTSHDNITCC